MSQMVHVSTQSPEKAMFSKLEKNWGLNFPTWLETLTTLENLALIFFWGGKKTYQGASIHNYFKPQICWHKDLLAIILHKIVFPLGHFSPIFGQYQQMDLADSWV